MSRADDALHALRVFARAGVLRPVRPDRLARAAGVLRHWGPRTASAVPLAAAVHGGRTAIVDERGALTYTQLDTRTNAIAHGLRALGLREGDTAGVLCRNHRGFVEAATALSKAGVHAVFMNTGFSGPQLREVSAQEGVTALVADDDLLPLAHDLGAAPVVVAWSDTPSGAPSGVTSGVTSLDALADAHPTTPPAAPAIEARTVILTSGTTGTPKGARRDHVSPLAPTVALLDAIPYRRHETAVVAAPLFHAWGYGNLAIGLLLGNTAVLERRYDPEATLAAISRHRAAVLVAVPVMLRRMLDLPDEVRRAHDTSSLRLVPLSGSAIPGGLAPAFMDGFGDVLYNLYGSTEVGYATVAAPADLRDAPDTAGRPPRGTEVLILDDRGRPVATGVPGRIFVRGPMLFDGYTGGANKEVVDGAMSTGDVGRVDARGLLFVEGRSDDMIVSGGENVFPHEVEALLEAHPGIVEAAVVGVPDDEWGQRLKAYVVRRDGGPDADEVRALVRTRLARYKVPRDVEFVDALPRNPTGKVLRRELT